MREKKGKRNRVSKEKGARGARSVCVCVSE